MSKIFYKAFIEDVQHEKCTEDEIALLIDIFNRTVKLLASTLARKAMFDLGDFRRAREQGLSCFGMTIERRDVSGREMWFGTFENGAKKLKVIATLEKDS